MSQSTNRSLILLLILGTLGILAVGVAGYLQLTGPLLENAARQRFVAEKILFLSLSAAALFLTAGGAIILKGVNIRRRLDRLIEQSRYRQLRDETDFRGFGALGPRLRDLYRALADANGKLTRKLASQGMLLEMIVANSPSRMLISDSRGTILFLSKGLLDSLDSEKENLPGKEISTLWKEIDFPRLRRELEDQFQPVSLELEEYPITAYPVVSPDDLVAYVLFNAEKRPFFYAPGTREQKKKTNRLQRDLSRLLKSRPPGAKAGAKSGGDGDGGRTK